MYTPVVAVRPLAEWSSAIRVAPVHTSSQNGRPPFVSVHQRQVTTWSSAIQLKKPEKKKAADVDGCGISHTAAVVVDRQLCNARRGCDRRSTASIVANLEDMLV
jgi:hypothetical protein